jgi:hypothetical protein
MEFEQQTCANCLYSERTVGGMVNCRRHAPVWVDARPQHPSGDLPQRAFPRLNDFDWCGDWSAQTVEA